MWCTKVSKWRRTSHNIALEIGSAVFIHAFSLHVSDIFVELILNPFPSSSASESENRRTTLRKMGENRLVLKRSFSIRRIL